VCRALGQSGIVVDALGSGADPARHSRFCREFVDLGSGEGVQERWLDWLTSRPGDGMVLLACNDEALELVARQRARLVEHGYRPLPADDAVVLALLDKHTTYEEARRIGVPAPRTILVPAGADVREAASGLERPLALKPRYSHRMARHALVTQKVFHAVTEHELEAHAERVRALNLDMLVTEIVAGPEDAYRSYYAFIDEAGVPVVEATKHKLRQFPVGFGLATYHVTGMDEETIEVGRRFCTGLGARGLVCVEFKRDSRSGRLTLIECNSRFTAANELMRHAGLDLALLAYNRAVGRPDPPRGRFRTGVCMWHPIEDLRAFLVSSRRGETTFRTWGRSVFHRQHFPLWSWRDPMPSLVSNALLPRRIFTRTRAGSRGAEPVDARRTETP